MPRETVVQPESLLRNPVGEGMPPGSRTLEEALGLSVGWNKIGWVQIHMFPKEYESTGDWSIVDLDRGSINRLIRTLRKARDAAYGADA